MGRTLQMASMCSRPSRPAPRMARADASARARALVAAALVAAVRTPVIPSPSTTAKRAPVPPSKRGMIPWLVPFSLAFCPGNTMTLLPTRDWAVRAEPMMANILPSG